MKWLLSAQYLVDNFIRDQPEDVPIGTNGRIARDNYYNYPLDTEIALKYVQQDGIPYEDDYPYTGSRDRSPQRKNTEKFEKVFISGYSYLGDTTLGDEGKEAIYQALVTGGPLVGTIDPSRAFWNYRGDGVLGSNDIESDSDFTNDESDSDSSNSSDESGDDDYGNPDPSDDSGSHDSGSGSADPSDNSYDPGSHDSGSGSADPSDNSHDPGSHDSGSGNPGSHDSDPSDNSGSHDSDDAGLMTHLIVIVGMDFDSNVFFVQNSLGLNWGKDGVGEISCDLIYDILEPNINDDRNRGFQGPASSYSRKQQLELKRLGKNISGQCLPREDISGKITPALVNGLESSDWKIRMESIEAVRPGTEKGSKHVHRYSHKSLCVLGNVDEPINPAWRWFYNVIGDSRCPISDTWWQTETCGFMIASLPNAWPRKPGSATFPFFGIKPAIVEDKGSGYLCNKGSWLGEFRALYGDYERYESAYFKPFPGYYFSGDGCSRDKDGYYFLTARVDGAINVSGDQIGTAEVGSALVSHSQCTEAAVVGVEHEVKGQGIYAFVTLAEGVQYIEELELHKSFLIAVRKQVIHQPKFWLFFQIEAFALPDKIHWVPGLPKTRSGKDHEKDSEENCLVRFKCVFKSWLPGLLDEPMIDLYVLDDDTTTWTKMYTIGPFPYEELHVPQQSFKTGEIVIEEQLHTPDLYFYDPKASYVSSITGIDTLKPLWMQSYSHTENLVSVNGIKLIGEENRNKKTKAKKTNRGWKCCPKILNQCCIFSMGREGVKALPVFWKVSVENLWGTATSEGWRPSSAPRSDWPPPPNESNGYLRVRCNGGLNQQRTAICNAVLAARIMNATLVLPELDANSFWHDDSGFQGIYDVEHFVNSLKDDVRIVESIPEIRKDGKTKKLKAFQIRPPRDAPVSWYTTDALEKMKEHGAIYLTPFSHRLAEEIDIPEYQRLRCRVNYHALRFKPQIMKLSNSIVSNLRTQGHFMTIHLRFEMDMLAFAGCYDIFNPEEQRILKKYRKENFKDKDLKYSERRAIGKCPLTPEEVGLILRSMGFDNSTRIYLAAGELFGGERFMKPFESMFPRLENHKTVDTSGELAENTRGLLGSAVDYMVCLMSDIFMPTYDGPSNFANNLMGHRQYHGFRTTLHPDRKALAPIFIDREKGRTAGFEEAVRRAMLKTNFGGPHKRVSPESFYTNSWPECFCQTGAKNLADRCPPDDTLQIVESQMDSEMTINSDTTQSNATAVTEK